MNLQMEKEGRDTGLVKVFESIGEIVEYLTFSLQSATVSGSITGN